MKTKQVFTSPAPSPLCLSFVKSTQGRKAAEAFRKCQLLPLGLHHMSCPSNKRVQASRYEKRPEYDIISLTVKVKCCDSFFFLENKNKMRV